MSLIAVIVLYKVPPSISAAFKTLQAASSQEDCGRFRLKILLYDNTPGGQDTGALPPDVLYETAGHNVGLAAAYNRALELGVAEECDWLITLDQDTALPPDFLSRVAELTANLENCPAVAAIVPQVTGDGRMLSPYWFWAGAIPRWFPKGFVGIPGPVTYAFNSASILRISALRQIGGYSPWFWLDDSDIFLYYQLNRYGKKVFVAGDIQVDHEFSMLDKQNRVTASRYHNALMAESAFWDVGMNWLAGLERTLKLFGRFCKHLKYRDDRSIRRETVEAIKRRLFHSRKWRIEHWKQELRTRLPCLLPTEEEGGSDKRPKLSVCMATYNGERFIVAQLESILSQLGPDDEVIIVDDASTDHTRDLVCSFRDKRIRMIARKTNRGVVSSFEEALENASGDILFLSDQDDLWAPEKVSKVSKCFSDHPEVKIVATRMQPIDEMGRNVEDDTYCHTRAFTPAFLPNLLANRFQGSTMAFRASLIPEILPFPTAFYVFHDVWIGVRNTLTGGKTHYIDESLLLYRRHSGNASHRLSRYLQCKKRLHLLIALGLRGLSDTFRWHS